jgi:Signal peptidase, peptidase S26
MGAILKENYVNPLLPEEAINPQKLYNMPRTAILQGNYFLIGDNRNNSVDSRFYGSFEKERLVGSEIAKYFILGEAKKTSDYMIKVNGWQTFTLPEYEFKQVTEAFIAKRSSCVGK